jgi:hypothetical protein
VWRGKSSRDGTLFLASDQDRLNGPDSTTDATALYGAALKLLEKNLSRGSWQIVVSSHLLRFATLPWSSALEQPETAEAYMAGRWRRLFDDSTGDWTLVLERGEFEQASTLLALPRSITQKLSGLLEAQQITGLICQPLITAAFAARAATLPQNCLFATLEHGCLAVAVIRHGHIEALSTHRVRGSWPEAVSQIHRRLMLQDPALVALGPLRLQSFVEPQTVMPAFAQHFTLLPRNAPDAAGALTDIAANLKPRHGFNLLPPQRASRRFERWALGVAAGFLFLAIVGHLGLSQQGDAEAYAVTTPAAPTLSAREKQSLVREVAAVNRDISALNLPVDALFAALSPRDLKDVALLSIDVSNAGEGKARVTAAAKTINSMESYLKLLEGRKDLVQINLLHHETASNGGEWPYRFTVEAQWQRP